MRGSAASHAGSSIAPEEGFPCYPLFARDPTLDGLRSEPRFLALLSELEAQWKGYRAAVGAGGGGDGGS